MRLVSFASIQTAQSNAGSKRMIATTQYALFSNTEGSKNMFQLRFNSNVLKHWLLEADTVASSINILQKIEDPMHIL